MAEVGILVVDDEPAVRRFLKSCLSGAGYRVHEAGTGQAAVEELRHHRPEIVILDMGLPDLEGTEVTRMLREWSRVPVLILSVRDQEEDIVSALDAGADDYLVKPFGVRELLARIRAALRRSTQSREGPILRTGGLCVDLAARAVSLEGRPIQLTPTEYELLKALVQEAGRVMTHRQLLRRVWGNAFEQDVHVLRVNISNLRAKIEPPGGRPRYIVTEPGVGYRLRVLDADASQASL